MKTGTWIRAVPVGLGLLGLAAAIALAAVEGRFLVWHYGLGALSVASMAGGLFWLHDVGWRRSLSTVVYTAFFLLSVVLVYMISANRHGRFDLTRDKTHTLAPQTRALLERLPADDSFAIEVFAPSEEHQQYARFLGTYRRLAPAAITFDLYDPARDLDAVVRLGRQPEKGLVKLTRLNGSGEVLRREEASIPLAAMDREHRLTNLLARTLQLREQVVYFTSGHNEKALQGDADNALGIVAGLVEQTQLPVRSHRLLTGPVPDDAAALVIAGPTSDLFDPEREIVEQYLASGGKVLLLLDPLIREAGDFGNIDAILAEFGMQAPNALVVDAETVNASQSAFTPMVVYNNPHPINARVDRTPFLLVQARPIEPLAERPPGTELEIALASQENVWVEEFHSLRSTRRPVPPDNPEEIGRRVLAMTAERPTPGGRFGDVARLAVMGDSDAFSNALVRQNEAPALFFLSTLGWLREERDMVYIPPKVLSSTPVTITPGQFRLVGAVFLLMGLALTLGGTTWTLLRRRVK